MERQGTAVDGSLFHRRADAKENDVDKRRAAGLSEQQRQ